MKRMMKNVRENKSEWKNVDGIMEFGYYRHAKNGSESVFHSHSKIHHEQMYTRLIKWYHLYFKGTKAPKNIKNALCLVPCA